MKRFCPECGKGLEDCGTRTTYTHELIRLYWCQYCHLNVETLKFDEHGEPEMVTEE